MSSNSKNHQIILRNRNHNKKYKLAIKKAIKRYLLTLQNTQAQSDDQYANLCMSNLSIVYKRIDKAVKRKVLHRNTAARKKARLAKILK